GDTRVAGAAGASDAVDVGLLVLRALVVDHVGDVVDVDAAGGDIGGHEHVDLALVGGFQRLFALCLAAVAVQGSARAPAIAEFGGQFVGRAFGAGEDDGASASLGLEHPGDEFALVHRMGAVDELGGVLSHQRQVFVVLSANVGGVVHVAAGQGDDRPGHGRGEQHRLPVRGHRIDDLLHI